MIQSTADFSGPCRVDALIVFGIQALDQRRCEGGALYR
jgi:hypothetical protein